MEKYNFDQIIDRRGTNCLKYDFAVERGKDADVLPLWVADMDFQVADGIRERLHQSVEHGILVTVSQKRITIKLLQVGIEKISLGNQKRAG